MKTAIAYVRVSTAEQAMNNLSLEGQKQAIEQYCKLHKIKLIRTFVEAGASAKSANRPILIDAISFCKINYKEVNFFIVWKLDRFARNTQDHAVLSAELRKVGVFLDSVTEQIDQTSSGRFTENVLAAVYQFENDNKADRTREGMKRRNLEGGFTAPAPLGYRNQKDALGRPTLVQTEEAPIIAGLFRDFLRHRYPYKELAEEADMRGLKTKRGLPIPYQSLRAMLENPVYAGYVRCKSSPELIEGLHEGLISKDEFYAIQEIIGKSETVRYVSDEDDWPLRNFVICDTCRKPLTSSTPKGRSGKRFPSYACVNCRKSVVGHRVSIPQEKLHEEFEEMLDGLRPTDAHLKIFKEAFLDKWHSAHKDKLQQQTSLEKKLSDLKFKRSRIIELVIAGTLTESEKFIAMESLEKEIVQTNARLNDVADEALDAETILEFGLNMIKDINKLWRVSSPNGKLQIQRLLFPEGISYNFAEGFRTTKINDLYEVIAGNSQKIQIWYPGLDLNQ